MVLYINTNLVWNCVIIGVFEPFWVWIFGNNYFRACWNL